jgi:hypothetical protein
MIAFTGMPQPVRNHEMTLESIQPNFQYVFHPGGSLSLILFVGVAKEDM